MQEKTCTKCDVTKPVAEFAKSKSGKHGVRSACKQCTNDYNAAYREANHDLVAAAASRWRAENAERVRLYNKQYYEENYVPRPRRAATKSKKEADQEYYAQNRETIIARATEWNKANPDRAREHAKKTQERRRAEPQGRIEDSMSASIRQSIKSKSKARRKWEDLLGYTVGELMAHLERQFQPGMTWNNYGRFGWHIDHRKPKSSFSYETPEDPQFKECWDIANLQPLWWRDNIIKGAKFVADNDNAANQAAA